MSTYYFSFTSPLLLILLLTASLHAGMTEKEAIVAALNSSKDIRVIRLQQQSDSLSHETVRAGYLPSLELNARQSLSPLDSSPLPGGPRGSTSSNASASLSQAVPGGGVLSGSVGRSETRFRNANGESGVTRAGIQFNQPLLRGAGVHAPLDFQLKISELDRKQFSESKRRELASRIAEVRRLYWTYYGKKTLLDVAASEEEYSRQWLDKERARFLIGQVSPLDTLSATLEHLQAQSRHHAARTDEQSARRNLAVALSLPAESVAVDSTVALTIAQPPAPDAFMQGVIKYDSQLRVFGALRTKLDLQMRNAQNRALPRLDLNLSYDRTFGRVESNNAAVALILSYSLPNRSLDLEKKQLSLSAQAAETERAQYLEQLRNEVDQLYFAWEQGRRSLEIAAASHDIARKVRDSAREAYDIGTTDRLAVEKASHDYLSAAGRLVQEKVQLKQVEVLLDEISGTRFSQLGVEIG